MRARTIATLAAAFVALGTTPVLAQYPSPEGSITTQPSTSNPAINGRANLLVAVHDEDGEPLDGLECTAWIASQPGTNASVAPPVFKTGDDGKAMLAIDTGSKPGQIRVGIGCGQLNATAMLNVGAVAPSSAPLPPNTGDGAAASQDRSNDAWLPFAAATVIVGGAGVTVLRVRRSR